MVLFESKDDDSCLVDLFIKNLTGVTDEEGSKSAAKEVHTRKGRCAKDEHSMLWAEFGACDSLKEGHMVAHFADCETRDRISVFTNHGTEEGHGAEMECNLVLRGEGGEGR